MASRPHGAVLQQIHRLFAQGSVSGLSEWQLLDRYASRRDESAFEALVARHGPMVLGVCRRVLDDPHAVEDAFQATFLVLVRKAGSLGERDAIGHWLYGVACRVALRARCDAARRRSREVPGGRPEAAARGDEPGGDELAAVLDEELGRLPAKYRAPVVLCFLEGLTHEEAARQLHWPIGSVKGRLARARELLRGRLARRGLAPSAALLAATQGREAAAAVSDSLRQATVQAAIQITAGQAPAAVASASIAGLAEGVLTTMYLTKLKVTAAILGASGLIAVGGWGLAQSSRATNGGAADARVVVEELKGSSVTAAEPAAAADMSQSWREALEKPIGLNLQNARLEDVLKTIKRMTQSSGNTGVPIYVEPEGLQEAGATLDSPVTINATKHSLRTALDAALRRHKLGATIRDGLLVVTSRSEVALIELQTLNEQLRRMPPRPESAPESAGPDAAPPVSLLKRMVGLRSTYFPDHDYAASPEDEAKTRAVLAALQKRIPIPFADETPLQEVIAYIKDQTKCQDLPDGIPFYVDPVGLNEAEKTMTSPVSMDVKGISLRESLRLMLMQVGLTYTVKDGLLTVDSESSEDRPTPMELLVGRAENGELSLREMNDLVEFFKARELVEYFWGARSSSESGLDVARGQVYKDLNYFGTARPRDRVGPPQGRAGEAAPVAASESPDTDADNDPKTLLIRAALKRSVPLHFQETPLEEAIARIRRATAGFGLADGIPVYRNPRSLNVALMNPTVTLDLGGVELKTALRLMLGQVGLAYTVKEGLLIIDKPDSPEMSPRRRSPSDTDGPRGGFP